MPIGPSHRRSSGGSSFSGGSSRGSSFGGGFSSGFGSSGGHRRIHRGPIRLRWFGGRTVIISTGRQTALIAFVVLLVAAIFGCYVTNLIRQDYLSDINNSKAYIAQCELDAEWYEMAKQEADKNIKGDNYFIAYAKEYSGVEKHYYNEYNPTGYYYDEFTGVMLNNVPYFYLIFKYEVPEDKDGDGINDVYIGETYSSFSSSQASGWDRKIIIGKDGGSWSAINYEYSIDTNKEYIFEKQLLSANESFLTTFTTAFVGCILVTIILVVCFVLYIVKTIKKGKLEFEKEQQKKDAEIAEAKAKSEEAQKRADQISRTCEYCGTSVPDGASECPNCGSSYFK